jgi:hypothetical protein
MDYTITLTETQQKAMEYTTPDVTDWITNFAVTRADIAINEIIALLVEHCNSNEIALEVGKVAQVAQAYSLGIVAAANAETPSLPE